MLPDGDIHTSLQALDKDLALRYGPHPGAPYSIRAKGIHEKLELFEIGRAFYHIGQRRGFLSNRRSPMKQDEQDGVVKTSIQSLAAKVEEFKTLGAYFGSVDPAQDRIRGRYTSRAMLTSEFDAIWKHQARYYPDILTDERMSKIRQAIFHQRPLKDQSDKVGYCSLIPSERRAAVCSLDGQRYRILDRVNSLRISSP